MEAQASVQMVMQLHPQILNIMLTQIVYGYSQDFIQKSNPIK